MLIRSIVFISALCLSCFACKEDPEEVVAYPSTGLYGDNILFQSKTDYNKRENSLLAQVPSGQSVSIRITSKSAGLWTVEAGTVSNWTVGPLDRIEDTQTFTSVDSGQTCEVKLIFEEGPFLIEYFEHDLSVPNFSKTITVNL